MPVKQMGYLNTYLRGVARKQAEIEKANEEERAKLEEQRKQEQHKVFLDLAKRATDDYEARREMKLEADQLAYKAKKFDFDRTVQGFTQDQLDRTLKGLPVSGAKVTPGRAEQPAIPFALEEGAIPAQGAVKQKVKFDSTGQEFEIDAPEVALTKEAERLKAIETAKQAPKLEQLQEKLASTEAQKELDRTSRESIAEENRTLKEAISNNTIDARATLAELERQHEKDLASSKAKADYTRTMDAVNARNAGAEARARISAAKSGTGADGKPVKLAVSERTTVNELTDLQQDLNKVYGLLEQDKWGYFKGPSFAGLGSTVKAIGGENEERWAAIQGLLGKVYAIKAHTLFGSALTATEKGLINAFLVEPSHFMKGSQAKANLKELIEAIPRMVDRIYSTAGGTAPSASSGSTGGTVIRYDKTGKRLP